eukprot:scaffold254345_cov39-Tisochrysis_lutea.AAC.1
MSSSRQVVPQHVDVERLCYAVLLEIDRGAEFAWGFDLRFPSLGSLVRACSRDSVRWFKASDED